MDDPTDERLDPGATYQDIPGSAYCWDLALRQQLQDLHNRVQQMRTAGKLTRQALERISKFFRLKNIYHSNAIEGNQLNLGETRLVVEQGLTITGKPLKDSAEARNLASALDYFEILARASEPLTCIDIRQLHSLILKGIDDDNAGRFRTTDVEISGSQFKPPGHESVAAQMTELCDWLQGVTGDAPRGELDAILLAAAAHTWFVRIHPFVDGNGRTARILMNLLLMRHGYPIAVLTKDDRERYYDALEHSQSSDLTPFVSLLVESVRESLEEYERAVADQTVQLEWAAALMSKFTEPQRVEASNYYELWKASMELFRSYVRQSADLINEQAIGLVRVYFTDYGTLDFEKYLSLRDGRSTKRTWFFRTDFRSAEERRRYLFFFGYPSQPIGNRLTLGDRVTLHVSTEVAPYEWERLDYVTPPQALPDLREVAYSARDEQFFARTADGTIQAMRVEAIVRNFFEQVFKRGFPS